MDHCCPEPNFLYADLPDGTRITLAWNSVSGKWEPIPAEGVTDTDISLLRAAISAMPPEFRGLLE